LIGRAQPNLPSNSSSPLFDAIANAPISGVCGSFHHAARSGLQGAFAGRARPAKKDVQTSR
jgi:hypothetical protein